MDSVGNIIKKIAGWISKIFSVKDLKDAPTPKKTSPKSSEVKKEKPVERNADIVIPSKTETKSKPQIEEKPKTEEKPKSKNTDKEDKSTGNATGAVKIDPDYSNRKGYNPEFLSVKVPLPKIPKELQSQIALTTEGAKKELKYHHFSVVMNGERKMPFFTAVNIDGLSYEKLGDVPSRTEIGRDKWYLDPRIAKDKQLDDSFYGKNDFDIGHQVRREDALWGDTLEEALKANNDTFHLTNAAPQHKDLNRNAKRWLGLETYALKNARKYGLKISVFTGPVFDDKDGVFNGVKIPDQFWKIIVMIKDDGVPSATGYIIQQNDLIEDIVTRSFVYEQFETYQVAISEIEDLTKIKFGLNDYDPIQKKSTRSLTFEAHPERIDSFDKIEF
ncbi:MAG: DNA/RNA non-specific endonuclease [Saprospiraceae bacterium]|nr:DNA/RNA non-specific endonuclease [Saprospiraceae bacterium]